MANVAMAEGRPAPESAAWFVKRQTALPLILVVGLGLRVFQLGTPSLWYDEVLSILISSKDPQTIISLTANDVHPPLYYWILHFWLVFGQSEFAVRLLSVLFGWATVIAVYFLAERLFDTRVGLLAALISALAPFQVTYSQEARMYTLVALLSVLTSFFLVKAIDLPRAPAETTNADESSIKANRRNSYTLLWWFLFALCTTLNFYTAYYAFFTLLAQDLFLLFLWKRWKRLVVNWLWSHALI
ncbi:MAG: glycosyltransferase family 39 protein, partial [Chloroflexi bacterium]|nr:glycosyltransferase family 39 protein [Chloroflexota bacterium]